jgi:hypothetical protein
MLHAPGAVAQRRAAHRLKLGESAFTPRSRGRLFQQKRLLRLLEGNDVGARQRARGIGAAGGWRCGRGRRELEGHGDLSRASAAGFQAVAPLIEYEN